jgi:hypothetical protein
MTHREYDEFCFQFGCAPYRRDISFEEAVTRQCKAEIAEACKEMRKLLKQIERRAKNIPDNRAYNMVRHSSLVRLWRNQIKCTRNNLEGDLHFGGDGGLTW